MGGESIGVPCAKDYKARIANLVEFFAKVNLTVDSVDSLDRGMADWCDWSYLDGEGGEEGAEEKASVGSAQLAMPPQAKAPQLAMTAQRATTPSAPLQAKGQVTALYQNKGATLTRTGGQHVQYAQGYKAGVAAAKKALLHEQALAAAKSRVSNTVAHK